MRTNDYEGRCKEPSLTVKLDDRSTCDFEWLPREGEIG